MAVFTLKKYEEVPKAGVGEPVVDPLTSEPKEEENKKNQIVTIRANDSVSSIVATALYNTMSNVDEDEGDSEIDAQVISTEDINSSPTDTWNQVKNIKNIIIVNEGFKTKKEEWFLASLESANVKVFYSIESYLRSIAVVKV